VFIFAEQWWNLDAGSTHGVQVAANRSIADTQIGGEHAQRRAVRTSFDALHQPEHARQLFVSIFVVVTLALGWLWALR
jgi:hypothetical protein